MKVYKKLLIVLFLVTCSAYMFITVEATSISFSSPSVKVGQSVTITVTVPNVNTVDLTANVSGAGTSGVIKIVDGSMAGNAKNFSNSITVTPTSVGTINVNVSSASNAVLNGQYVDVGNSKSITVVEAAPPTPTQPVKPPANTNNNNNAQANKTPPTNNNVANTNTANNTAKNNNAFLSKLQVNYEGLSPNFNRAKTNYSISIGPNVNSLNVTAVPEVSTSKVSVTGNTNLKDGDNKIYITVTAQDGTQKVYSITATRSADPVKSNSYLQNLIVENATLSPEFSKEVFEYDCGTVGASVENLKILAFGENENVKIEITGNDKLNDGDNVINVKVTSEDQTTTKEYVIKVNKDPNLVEEEQIEEINNLDDVDGKKGNKIIEFLKKVWHKIRNHLTLVIMSVVILMQLVLNVYLFLHQDKSKKINRKKDTKSRLMRNLKETESITSDKTINKEKKIKRIGAKKLKDKD